MNKTEVESYFNQQASTWDARMKRNEKVIQMILDNAGISKDKNILDVACGTGVLIPDYLERDVASIIGIDIASNMIQIAKDKFHDEKVLFICGDVETYSFPTTFDCINVYNAFPHFAQPKELISILSSLVCVNGYISIAHGMSREKLHVHHEGPASAVSIHLLESEELAALFNENFEITTMISNTEMYQVVAKRIK